MLAADICSFGYGASRNKAKWELSSKTLCNACLLVIDGQKKYLHNTTAASCLPHILTLIRCAKQRKIPVYWTRFTRIEGQSSFAGEAHHDFVGGGEAVEQRILQGDEDIIPEIGPRRNGFSEDSVFETHAYSSFSNKSLAKRLRSHGSVVICGGWSDFCVLTTCFDAIDRDLKVVIAKDAVFSGARSAERKVDGWSKQIMANGCGRVELTEKVVRQLQLHKSPDHGTENTRATS